MTTIELTDVGPVEHVTIPLPEGGGITVLRGRNDIGKSVSLEASQRALGGKQTVSRRDGAAGPGKITGPGITLTVGAATRTKGELECLSLEDRLTVAALVDPQIKDPVAADAARIKTLCNLTGVKADISLFDNDCACDASTKTSTAATLVEMAASFKRDMEQVARDEEDEAKKLYADANAHQTRADAVDNTAECDGDKLQEAHTAAVAELTRVTTLRDASNEADRTAADSRAAMEKAVAYYEGKTLKELAPICDAARDLAEKLREQYEIAQQAVTNAVRDAKAARNHEATMKTWQADLDKADDARAKPFADDIILDCQHDVYNTKEAIEKGAVMRDAKKSADTATAAFEDARAATKAAERYREAAASTDAVLSCAIQCEAISVRDGRLVTTCDRGEVFYAERSRGTRWKIAIDIAVARLRDQDPDAPAILAVPQEAWEGLDYQNRAELLAHCLEREVNLLTAEADTVAPAEGNGNLRAEVYQT